MAYHVDVHVDVNRASIIASSLVSVMYRQTTQLMCTVS